MAPKMGNAERLAMMDAMRNPLRKPMGELHAENDALLQVAERCKDWAISAQMPDEQATAVGMYHGLTRAAADIADAERDQLVRFARAMLGMSGKARAHG